MNFKKKIAVIFFSIVAFILCLSVSQVFARIVNNIDIRTRATGYEIRIQFIIPLRYIKHRPTSEGEALLVEMSPVSGVTLDNLENFQQLGDREALSWDRSIPVPLREINYDDGSPDRVKLVFRFTRKVEYSLQSSGDLRTLIVFVKAKTDLEAKAKKKVKKGEELEPDLPQNKLSAADPQLVNVMEEANKEMTAENYPRAIQLYTKILTRPESDLSPDAQEFLGLARERNNQLAHAKAEYEKYLKKYPEGSGADRVLQRLTGLLTAGDRPKEKLRKARIAGNTDQTVWDTQVFGSFSQFFSYDKTDSDTIGGSRVNRKDLNSNLDLNTRFRSDKYEIRSQFVGGYNEDLRSDGQQSEVPINTFTVEARDLKRGVFGRFGRQFESSGGVLGRYDGGWLGYEVNPQVKVNGVFGFPVARTTADPIDTEKHFYGLNLDLGTYAKYWNFNIYGINQEVNGITDRQAVGGEARYFHPKKSFLTLMDYDVSYSNLNLFIFSGDYVFPEKTRWHIGLDYRKSPLLTTSSALQGQSGVENISQLLNTFSEDEIRGLAQDRTAISKSLIFSVTQDLNDRYQLNGEFSVSELSGTPASGGVEATPTTGAEFFYSTQLIASSLFMEGDITIFGLRYSDLQNVDSYSADLNTRFPITRNLRINPRVRLDYRKNKNGGGDRTNIRPLVRLDYRYKKWLRFELEGGREWSNETVLGDSQKSSNYFFSLGARAFF
jgi:tetratricopeptide (TPR) repeat protein